MCSSDEISPNSFISPKIRSLSLSEKFITESIAFFIDTGFALYASRTIVDLFILITSDLLLEFKSEEQMPFEDSDSLIPKNLATEIAIIIFS